MIVPVIAGAGLRMGWGVVMCWNTMYYKTVCLV